MKTRKAYIFKLSLFLQKKVNAECGDYLIIFQLFWRMSQNIYYCKELK